jgi:hypothetical protein
MDHVVIPLLRRFCQRYIYQLMVEDPDNKRNEHRLLVVQIMDDFLKWAEENQ